MKKAWSCPLCGNKKWIRKRSKMWDQKIFHKRKLLTCGNCQCCSMHPMPTKEELNNINECYWSVYSNHSSKHRAIRKSQALSRVHYINKFINLSPTEKMLDIGSGFGHFLDAMKQVYHKVNNYYAVEPDKKIRYILFSKGTRKIFPDIDYIQEKNFSLVIMSHILEHLSNPREFLIQVLKSMKKDAILFLEVPNREDLYNDLIGLHTIVFNVPALYNLMIDVGFHIIDITTAGFPIPMLTTNRGFFYLLKKKTINLIPRRLLDNTLNLFKKKRLIKFIFTYLKIISNEKINQPILSLMLNDYGKDRIFIRVLARK